MIDWWNRRRLNAAKVSLAGYEAKLKQTKDLFCRPNVSDGLARMNEHGRSENYGQIRARKPRQA